MESIDCALWVRRERPRLGLVVRLWTVVVGLFGEIGETSLDRLEHVVSPAVAEVRDFCANK